MFREFPPVSRRSFPKQKVQNLPVRSIKSKIEKGVRIINRYYCLSLLFTVLSISSASAQELSDYRLGSGDLVSIRVFGEEDLSMKIRLSDAGTISYPFLGELQVSEQTISALEQLIITGLKGDYLIDPKVTVTVLEYRKFFINGEVEKTGGYAFVPGLTVHKAISLAGGFTSYANRNKIMIEREQKKEHEEEKEKKRIRAKLDTPVYPGDIITVKESFF
ncbi:MAG: polysaccharide export protein [Gammaproteobacteria bacterium]|nr:polysaccharide export protein [Gammaproteobacteria bacterium]